MDFERYVFSSPYLGWLCWGVVMTLLITAVTTVLSLMLGLLVAGGRVSASPLSRAASAVYILVFRNTPPVPLLLLFLIFGLPGAFQACTGHPFPRGMEYGLLMTGLSLNTSAYLAEILQAGVRGVPQTQWDAGRVMGLGPRAVRYHLIYPQALRIALPALGNRLIHNMKNSTMALVLPLNLSSMEVLGQVARVAGQTFAWAAPLVFAAVVHLGLAFAFSAALNHLARRSQQKVEVAR